MRDNVELRFNYTLSGRIETANASDEAAIETITRLGLNHDELIGRRKVAIAELADYSDRKLDSFARSVTQPKSDGAL
ncbi:MAG: hypothetical protein ACKVHP_12750, partial [Verrucomicrobiales bacterium]